MQLIQFLTNRGTQLVMFGFDNSGSNWCTWSRHLGTQLIQFLDPGTQLLLPRLPCIHINCPWFLTVIPVSILKWICINPCPFRATLFTPYTLAFPLNLTYFLPIFFTIVFIIPNYRDSLTSHVPNIKSILCYIVARSCKKLQEASLRPRLSKEIPNMFLWRRQIVILSSNP